ncbi:hypothetical protein MSM1_20280 [Mycobacterium sp. SM1]|uniref:hypothetical protein n=1 Tax=Mycobacterium sp. SM1 TaxID=2816243 RepID=UPI001BCCBDB6|nr:hypothetical protein [Mycobacterium sp. SM1]MBS4730557.1 hypothetical protein [Mycobacterium sp. SM1]
MVASRDFVVLEQAVVLAEHCRHARFVWNLAENAAEQDKGVSINAWRRPQTP